VAQPTDQTRMLSPASLSANSAGMTCVSIWAKLSASRKN
jgi:hypothetical protein